MSNIRYDIAGGTGSGTTTDNMSSRAKAWFICQLADPGQIRSFNTGSTLDNAVGYWTVNLTAALSASMSPCPAAAANPGLCCTAYCAGATVPLRTFNMAATLVDDWGQFAAFGPLA
ncbi:MAG: hypothetical protein ABWY63_14210 [Hyphomicrobiaceae bacterium]